jgi:hypothetical protein
MNRRKQAPQDPFRPGAVFVFNAGCTGEEEIRMKPAIIAAAAFLGLVSAAGSAAADPGDRGGWRGEPRFEQSASDWRGHTRGHDRERDRGWGASYDRRWDVSQRLDWIDRRIRAGFDRGQLTRREARFLSRDLQRIVDLRRAYARDGLSRSEALDLDDRLDRLSDRVRFERRDDDFRHTRRDWRDYR